MALSAGYYGVKRFLRDKLKSIAGTYDETIKSLFPRSEQAVLGAKNLIKYPYTGAKTDTVGGVTYTYNDDGTIKFDGTALSLQGIAIHYRAGVTSDSNPIILPAGTYKLSKNSNQSLSFEVYITVNNTKTTLLSLDGNTNEGEFTLSSDTQIGLTLLYPQGAVFDNFIFKPMLRLATDPDDTYVPYAMTNKELTNSAADQKTAINAIITAATGAADFAAFKTAMGAITPVTRSLSLTKEDITEEVKEDVEPEKSVTKKRTTKKTEEV